jgi:hypothetical protein
VDFQKGAPLYDDDSRNRQDESFSDKFRGSKTTTASCLATAIPGSANVQGVELVAGRCRARTRARKYDNHWLICTGPRICKRSGHNEKRERELLGNLASMLRCLSRGGHKVGVLEDTLTSEKVAWERAGRQREATGLPLRARPKHLQLAPRPTRGL